MVKTYIVRIETDAPEDIDESMRRAVTYLSNTIDPSGNYAMTIDVTDGESNLVTGHYYDPKEFEDDNE